MNSVERRVVDIGGGDGRLAREEAMMYPDVQFFVVDGADEITCPPSEGNVKFVHQYVEPGRPLPFEDKSISIVRMNFLLGQVVTYGNRSSSRGEEIMAYRSIAREAARVLSDTGVLQVTEVQANVYDATTVFFQVGFYVSVRPMIAPKGLTYFTDEFFACFEGGGQSESESAALPIYFEMQKLCLPGLYGY